jgi:hypothetical protein
MKGKMLDCEMLRKCLPVEASDFAFCLLPFAFS